MSCTTTTCKKSVEEARSSQVGSCVSLSRIVIDDCVQLEALRMNNREVVVQRIIEWLKVEALSYTLKENNSDKFRATIELNQSLDLDIQLMSQRPDRVMLLTQAYLAPNDQRAYSRLDQEKKEAFLRAVRWALLNIDVDHQINPNADTLQSISISKVIYFDGFTRDKFFNSVLLLKRAFDLLDLVYCDHLRFRSSSNIVSR
jgi:hypothetical protein